ncbi:Protein of unknown function [Bacillus wiedmannii]|uniref:Uncharacterized protein n=1 Tax=Bacillus wiedmannii TaxID=1890302 RepID=A0AB37YS32_9BACI|nr:Protein of unknown function [Bacillus wiedmannii]
MMAEDIMAKQV